MLTLTDSKDGKMYEIRSAGATVKANDMYISEDGEIKIAYVNTSAIRTTLNPIKWRANTGEGYHRVVAYEQGAAVDSFVDYRMYSDDVFYDKGNYYRTKKDAQAVADKINAIFKEG